MNKKLIRQILIILLIIAVFTLVALSFLQDKSSKTVTVHYIAILYNGKLDADIKEIINQEKKKAPDEYTLKKYNNIEEFISNTIIYIQERYDLIIVIGKGIQEDLKSIIAIYPEAPLVFIHGDNSDGMIDKKIRGTTSLLNLGGANAKGYVWSGKE